jgi:hypothetical protein
MKIALYTCVTGGYDPVRTPQFVDSRLDYYCFTDQPNSVPIPWIGKSIELPHLLPKDQNRYIKMHPHQFPPLSDYDLTVYVDGSILVVGDIFALCEVVFAREGDIFMYEHPGRSCIYSEAAACSHYSHDWVWTISRQMHRYRSEGYPQGNGLFEAGVIFRRDTPAVRRLMDMWWVEYDAGTHRDQLSLPYAAWKSGVVVASLGRSDHRFEQQYFKFIDHVRRIRFWVVFRKYVNRIVATLFSQDTLFGSG